jgi:hypothetical protein
VAYIAPAHPPRDLVPRNVSRRRFELACECAERVVDLHSPSGDFLYAYGHAGRLHGAKGDRNSA